MPQEPNEPQSTSQNPESPAGQSAQQGSASQNPQQPAGSAQSSGCTDAGYYSNQTGYQTTNYQPNPSNGYSTGGNGGNASGAGNVLGAGYSAGAGNASAGFYGGYGTPDGSNGGFSAAPGTPHAPVGYSAQAQGWGTPPSSAQMGSVAVKPSKSHGWIVGIVVVVALCLVTMFGMWSCSNAFSSAGANVGSDADLLTSDTIAIINIDGTIQYDGTTSSPEGLKVQLDIAANNSHIKAVVLRVNSGGGTATAGEEMTEYVRDFKETTGKPVVVSSASTNASAAYEISSQADYIYVAKTTAIGAIGTAMQFMDYSGLMEMLGITTENITSSDSKDSTYGTRALTDEERAYYQAQIDQINETFIENVAEGRAMTTDEVRALATGLTFTGLDAVENGLADEVGTQEDAVAKAAELAGCSTTATITLEDTSSSDDLSLLLDLMSSSNTQTTEELAQALKELDASGSVKQ